ncbi:hypothetical protein CYK80_12335 [Clostridium perfringens]|uniref:Uncharacterized protein n=1 Tax=Clostridium perfringens TaxID=1502 RepID=A0AB37C4U5_CLOPF|nr:hypothetical protein [Clostridium perfringens]MDK0845359.1 hypothetical protein [Clostridium perfringens]MDM0722428.1 hypothetical protein [Clostridium perfringens]MDM0725492.1 hypothetical protein [Clostridium perfringens]NGU53066.1 hypothetical protein [Clostridium perfringens]PWX37186.1 hypothetical protein CYK91_13590 [Clostridium perfringens]
MSINSTIEEHTNGVNKKEIISEASKTRKFLDEIIYQNPTKNRFSNLLISINNLKNWGMAEATIGNVKLIDLEEFLNVSLGTLEYSCITSKLKEVISSAEFNPISYGYDKKGLNEITIKVKEIKKLI